MKYNRKTSIFFQFFQFFNFDQFFNFFVFQFFNLISVHLLMLSRFEFSRRVKTFCSLELVATKQDRSTQEQTSVSKIESIDQDSRKVLNIFLINDASFA